MLIPSIFQFDNTHYLVGIILELSLHLLPSYIPLLNRATLVPHLSPTIGTIRPLNTNCQDAM
ncbi:MAG: hypothetical protein ACKPAE_06050 [Microcystis panniformis]